MTPNSKNLQLEKTFNFYNVNIVKNEYFGFTIYTKEIFDFYISIAIDIKGNKVITKSNWNDKKTSVEKAQNLIYKIIKSQKQ